MTGIFMNKHQDVEHRVNFLRIRVNILIRKVVLLGLRVVSKDIGVQIEEQVETRHAISPPTKFGTTNIHH
jgi:hypothetical protein